MYQLESIVAKRTFDRRLGEDALEQAPSTPGVYRFFNEAGAVIYVGRAKNLRRRLSQYRNAKRRKKHLKMREIVADAARVEWAACASHLDACLEEARLIQTLRPKWNIAGAFHFLYPMIGLADDVGNFHFCYTTSPEQLREHVPGVRFHGAFRSRQLTREAFFALMELLRFVGHSSPKNKHRSKVRFSHHYIFRQLPEGWIRSWDAFFRGESRDALAELILALTENAGARRSPKKIQKLLNALARFWRHEIAPLRKAREVARFTGYPVPQSERDFIFLRYRHQSQTDTLVSS
jgi:hypothetical protein